MASISPENIGVSTALCLPSPRPEPCPLLAQPIATLTPCTLELQELLTPLHFFFF